MALVRRSAKNGIIVQMTDDKRTDRTKDGRVVLRTGRAEDVLWIVQRIDRAEDWSCRRSNYYKSKNAMHPPDSVSAIRTSSERNSRKNSHTIAYESSGDVTAVSSSHIFGRW